MKWFIGLLILTACAQAAAPTKPQLKESSPNVGYLIPVGGALFQCEKRITGGEFVILKQCFSQQAMMGIDEFINPTNYIEVKRTNEPEVGERESKDVVKK